jgi:hypothetical protein
LHGKDPFLRSNRDLPPVEVGAGASRFAPK